ncbi:MAG: hypothetical protein HFF84_12315 [Oscillibacter sp.]|nr:hypothetical protein [Oscillibacter sp.]
MKGTGNSRFLKSVSGFLALYPTYEAFADALVSGTLPVDLNGVNEEGWAELGTPLDKASLLTDATAALAGLGDEATPNEMFAALAGRTLAGTTDLTAGTSDLSNGVVYLVYK